MDNKDIIVVFGAKGSGKDTVGEWLFSYHGFRKASFAAPLKTMARIAFPMLKHDDLWGSSEKRETPYECYPIGNRCMECEGHLLLRNDGKQCEKCHTKYPEYLTPRVILQTLGTNWGRRLHKDVWATAALDSIRNSPDHRHVITDGRFQNELVHAQKAGGFCVLLLRNRAYSTVDTHESEQELLKIPAEKFDYVIDNRGVLSDLYKLLELMMERFMGHSNAVKQAESAL